MLQTVRVHNRDEIEQSVRVMKASCPTAPKGVKGSRILRLVAVKRSIERKYERR